MTNDERQGTKGPFVLPENVYRQALYAIKDLPRLKQRLQEEIDKSDALPEISYAIAVGNSISDRVGNMATEQAYLAARIEQIESALLKLPEEYRKGVFEKLCYRKPYKRDHHINTWKKYQQMYVFYVANNLNIL